MSAHSFNAVFPSFRANFLLLPIVLIMMTVAIGYHQSQNVNWLLASLVLLEAVLAHVLVNLKNEIEDSQSGLDAMTHKTPFSGGTGALLQNNAVNSAKNVFNVLALVFFTIGIGILAQLDFEQSSSLALISVVLIGVLIIWTYTSVITQKVWLSLFASGAAFGPILMSAAFFTLFSMSAMEILLWSLIPFFLVNNLLLINQIPDQFADKKIGRNNWVIQHGNISALNVYILKMVAAISLMCVLAFVQHLEYAWALLLWALLAGKQFKNLQTLKTQIDWLELEDNPSEQKKLSEHPILLQAQGLTVLMNLGIPLSIALTFALSSV